MKYRIKDRPSGYYSVAGGPLAAWPNVGELVELSPAQAEGMIRSGHVEAVEAPAKVETRPAPSADVETRAPKKQASAKRTETRKD